MLLDIDSTFTFQTFDDSKAKRSGLVRMLHGSFDACRDELKTLNAKGAGIFFTVNETDLQGREASNIKRVRAVFADLDTPELNRTFAYPLPPSYVIESSPGKHQIYWLLADELPLSEFASYQKAIAMLLGGDPKIIDLPRVMRVPGFLHQKTVDHFQVRELISTGARYTVEQVKDWLTADGLLDMPMVKAQKTEVVKAIPHTVDDPDAIKELDDLIDTLLQAGEGERNNTLNLVAFRAYGLWKAGRLAKDYVTDALILAAVDIGLSENEARTTMRSARAKAKPVVNDLDLLPVADVAEIVRREKSFGLQIDRCSELSIRATRWLWDGWLARGEMHILAGSPSTGKTTICLSMAATMSTGGRWPDGTICIQRNVVIWSGEDAFETTLGPRLLKSGADLKNIYVINGVTDASGKRSFDPAKDTKYLVERLAEIGNIGLIIVDPIVSAVAGDSHKNNEVRRGLQPLCDVARMFNAALIGITHLTKGTQGRDPVERLTGSVAFGALARVVMMAVKTVDENSDVSRVFVRAKSNIGKDDGGFNYVLDLGAIPEYADIETTSVLWGDWVEGHARDILGASEQTQEERSTLDDAKQFLRDYLDDGPRDAKSVAAEARKQQISRATLYRVKTLLRVKTARHGFGGGSEWSLPEHENPLDKLP